MTVVASNFIYVFLDEGGDLNFSPSGSKYFTFTTITTKRPFQLYPPLSELRFDWIEKGIDLEYFHATEDRQVVRDSVFAEIQKQLGNFRIDSIIVEKRKTGPALWNVEKFYPMMMGYLVRFLHDWGGLSGITEVVVMTDTLPGNKRKAIEKAVKTKLAAMLPASVHYRLLHISSKAAIYLQVADYCNWAIYRKWEAGDRRSYDLISSAVKSEFDIFRTGSTHFY